MNELIDTFPLEPFTFESVTLDRNGQITGRKSHQAWKFSEPLGQGIVLELVKIPDGTFQMGSLHGQGYADETPRHLVSVTPFLIGGFLITQEQWQMVMGKPAQGRFKGATLPVERVCWKDAQAFCQRLARKTGRAYRLPSEAEWEYACRAGTAGPFYTGETLTTDYANYVGEHLYVHEPKGIYRHTTTPAGTFLPNPFGVQDMSGNLWEFCADRWHPDYTGAPFNAGAWEWSGEPGYRVARGGSWHETPGNCRSAARLRVAENERDEYYGFRVALS